MDHVENLPKHNLDAISYEQTASSEKPKPKKDETVPRQSHITETETIRTKPLNVTVSPPAPVAPIEDLPPTTSDVVAAIVASGLKKRLNNASTNQSIKVLCAGRSTLQNEILGDLDAEFGSLPDGAEDLALESLCDVLQTNFTGKLGKKSFPMKNAMRMTCNRLASRHKPQL